MQEINENIKDLISWWVLKAEKEEDPFYKFFTFYICFDAWITAGSGKSSDKDKLSWFIDTDNELKRLWRENIRNDQLEILKGYSPIKDMRPDKRGNYINLTDIANFQEVVMFIYQIRCNRYKGSAISQDCWSDIAI
jgi:hypothetical protein